MKAYRFCYTEGYVLPNWRQVQAYGYRLKEPTIRVAELVECPLHVAAKFQSDSKVKTVIVDENDNIIDVYRG